MSTSASTISGWLRQTQTIGLIAIIIACMLGTGWICFAIGYSFRNKPLEEKLNDAHFSKQLMNEFYQKLMKKQILYYRQIEIFDGTKMDVAVVEDSYARVEYGFITLSNTTSELWIEDLQRYALERYDANHLFVMLRQRYANQIEKTSLPKGNPGNKRS